MVELFLKLGFTKRQANRLASEYPTIESLLKAIESKEKIFTDEQIKIIMEHQLSEVSGNEQKDNLVSSDLEESLHVEKDVLSEKDLTENSLNDSLSDSGKNETESEFIQEKNETEKTESENVSRDQVIEERSEEKIEVKSEENEIQLNDEQKDDENQENELESEVQVGENVQDVAGSGMENLFNLNNLSSSQPIRYLFYNTSGVSYFVMLSNGRTYQIHPYSQFEVSRDIAEDSEFKKLIENFTIIKLY